MDTRKITLIATIAAIALVAVGIGYAYTATTENSDNNADNEYVVLKQIDYNFGGSASAIQLYTSTTNTKTGTTYILNNDETTVAGNIITGSDTENYLKSQNGKLIGKDVLTASTVGTVSSPLKVTMEATGFTNFNSKYWTYIFVVEEAEKSGSANPDTSANYTKKNAGDTFYIVYDGATATYYNSNFSKITSNPGLSIKKDTPYLISLYFGGETTENKAQSTYAPAPDSGAAIIDNGVVTFKYKSNGES